MTIGRPPTDMKGLTFGRLTVVDCVSTRRLDQVQWLCRCSCGGEITVPGSYLRSGRNKSCGCFRRDRMGDLFRKHGLSKTVPYTMFYDARKRATSIGLPFNIEPTDIAIPEYCPVLGMALTLKGPRDTRPSLDRKIPSLGYVRGNIFVISFRANRMKSDACAEDLRAILAYMEAK